MSMKKSMVMIMTLIGLVQIKAIAQSANIHLSWTGLKKVDTETTMAVTWKSKVEQASVRYGMDSTVLSQKVQPAIRLNGESKEQNFNCKAELSGLNPATVYYYQCGSDKEGWSAIYSFKTAPKLGEQHKYVIGVWGDTQNNAGNQAFEQTGIIVNRLVKYPLNLSIHMGDIVENGSVLKSWADFLHITEPVNAKAPLMPVAGNHDVNNKSNALDFQKPFQIFYDSFNLPRDYLNYSYDYGNIHFVAVNSGFAQGAAKVGQVLFEKGSLDYKWLEDDLARARRNKKITWIILYAHYPVYSYGVSHIPDWQKNMAPILDKYKVDLCLTGHRHVYERHKAIRAGLEQEQKGEHIYNHPTGTVYITNGSAGGSLQGTGGANMPSMQFTSAEKTYNYAIMTVEGRQINYEVYNSDNEKMDYFKIIK